jgi:hypothetical protein
MKTPQRRLILFISIALVAIVILSVVAAPYTNTQQTQQSGSTYGRSPSAYGAWYEFVKEKGVAIERWQKPLAELVKSTREDAKTTFLQINPNATASLARWSKDERDWLKKGNTIIILGITQPVTEADFTTFQKSSVGQVKIDTRRRNNNPTKALLSDSFGAVVWEEKSGKGKIIYCTTPHLAANAYQDFPGNYEFLAQLVAQTGKQVWVDEYLHGYKDKEALAQEIGEDIVSYLAKTPLIPVLIQSAIVLLIVIWASNQRFGKPLSAATPAVENSQAYIQALAGVLQKAKSSDFLVSTISKEERRQLQKALGLEETLLEPDVLIEAWVEQTGRSPVELESLLQAPLRPKMSEVDLLIWIEKWQTIRRSLTNA